MIKDANKQLKLYILFTDFFYVSHEKSNGKKLGYEKLIMERKL